jgi:hypothetical protein
MGKCYTQNTKRVLIGRLGQPLVDPIGTFLHVTTAFAKAITQTGPQEILEIVRQEVIPETQPVRRVSWVTFAVRIWIC